MQSISMFADKNTKLTRTKTLAAELKGIVPGSQHANIIFDLVRLIELNAHSGHYTNFHYNLIAQLCRK